ncbi:MAG TPA: HEAT repeat domain-containing protein [Phycisphaerae bacterium]|nr:HEAT repeat domain-containing protein [Phycisphaerae bacterium]
MTRHLALRRQISKLCGLGLIACVLTLCGCTISEDGSTSGPPQIQLEPAIQVLQTQAMQNDDPHMRAIAVESVEQLDNTAAVQIVAHGLSDPSPIVRFSAAMVCGTQQMYVLKPQVEQLLNDPDQSVQVAAIFALSQLGEDDYLNRLPAMFSSSDPTVRGNVAMVLGDLGNKSAIDLLLSDANEPNPGVKFSITEALAQLGYPDAISSIIALSLSVNAEDHLEALSACRELTVPVATNVLLSGLSDPDPSARLIAARGLGMRGSLQGEQIAVQYAADSDPNLRVLAALALGSMRVTSNIDVLNGLLSDPNPKVRIAAAAGLIRLNHLAQMDEEMGITATQ